MATLDDFTIPQGWCTKTWTVDQSGPIPSNAFPVGGYLLIGAVPGLQAACSLFWLNENGLACTITNLQFSDGSLSNTEDIDVSFGENSFKLKTVEFSIDETGLHGTLQYQGVSDGNTGTYAADANPPVPVAPRVRVEELAST